MDDLSNETKTEETSETDTAKAIENLKAQVDSLSAQNADLLKAKAEYYDKVLNSNPPSEDKAVPSKSSKEIREDMIKAVSNGRIPTNLEYCTLLYELDNAVREETGESAFVPKGSHVGDISPSEYASADHISQVLGECIEGANGDPDTFNLLLSKRIKKEPIKSPGNRRT